VFVSILCHLVGKPFDVNKKNSKRLHDLEFAALTVCFFTFWGGLLFFLGHEKQGSVSVEAQVIASVLLVGSNCVFLLGSLLVFLSQYLIDRKAEIERKATKRRLSGVDKNGLNTTECMKQLTQVVPILPASDSVASGGDFDDDNITTDNVVDFVEPGEGKQIGKKDEEEHHRISSLSFIPNHHLGHFGEEHSEARTIHDDFHIHEEGLRNKTEKLQKRARRNTQFRLKARIRLKDSKALHKLQAFQELDDKEVDLIIDQMDHIARFKGDALCHQHDSSDSFYIILKGSAVVTVDVDVDGDGNNGNGNDKEEIRPEQMEVGRIEALGFFGEGALLNVGQIGEQLALCTATVTVDSDKCDLLRLKSSNFLTVTSTFQGKFFFLGEGGVQ
jgi:hypothetical protein